MFPEVDDALVNYEVCRGTNAPNCDPLTILQKSDGKMRKSENTGSMAKFPFHGNFDL